MTDIPNYGPVRRLSPLGSADSRKPYSRTGLKGVLRALDLNSGDAAVPTTPDSPYYPLHVETPRLEAPSQHPRRSAPPDGPRDVPGFPTFEQYQRIEDEYLSSLSERKRPKALVSQALFDRIFAVLQNGNEDRASTAQFRFWVRKMFVLAYPQTSFSHSASGQTPEPVVLHDKRPVAVREQLYEVLCYCHAIARHGGRDKTCATLRLHYSWVPKELTAKFVKSCPTCTLKRSGNPDLLSRFGAPATMPPLYAPTAAPAEPAASPLFPGGPNDTPPGLNFVVGSASCDDGGGEGGFCPSIFGTPDLSVYPSPTLSAGSLGPTTPSPYLPGGLFGYPVVFDPGHGSLHSVAAWVPSPVSPCMPMYAEEMCASTAKPRQHQQPADADEAIDTRGRDLQLHLPTQKVPMHTHADGRRSAGLFPEAVTMPCPVDIDIDPALLMEEVCLHLAFVGPAPDADADADMEADNACEGGADGRPYLNLAAATVLSSSSSPSPSSLLHGSGRPVQRQQQVAPPFGLALSTGAAPMMSMGSGGSTDGWQRPPLPPTAAAEAEACSFGSHGVPPQLVHAPLPLPPRPPASRSGATMSAPAAPALRIWTDVTEYAPPCGRHDGAPDDEAARCAAAEAGEGGGDGAGFSETGWDAGAHWAVNVMAVEAEAASQEEPRWERPEAWLVQSDSYDDGAPPDAVV